MPQSISFQEATALATSGNAEAQYAISSLLHKRGKFDESLYWMHRAATQGLIPAQITLATYLMDGRHCPRDRERAVEWLSPLAASHAEASLLLGEIHGFTATGIADHEAGLSYLCSAARLGHPGALRQLALLCVCHQRWDHVRPLLDASARNGDAAAAYALACCYSEGIGGTAEPEYAAAIDGGEPARSHYFGGRLEQHLGGHKFAAFDAKHPALNINWSSLEQSLPDLAADIPLPNPEVLHQAPLVRRFRNVIHPLVLDSVINLAAPLVKRSQIVDARTGEVRADPMRNSSHVTLSPRQHDHVFEALEHCISRASGMPAMHGEFIQILRYRQGEEFRPHVDYFNESGGGTHQSLVDGGQRAQTVLIYMNDDYRGGSTFFPILPLDIRGHRGDLLHFHNVDSNGVGHRNSLHAGMPIVAGEKWLLSKWIRSQTYPPRVVW